MHTHGLPRCLSGKESTCQCRRHKRRGFDAWVRKIPWRRAWQPTPVFLPGKSHAQRSLKGYSPWGQKSQIHALIYLCLHRSEFIFVPTATEEFAKHIHCLKIVEQCLSSLREVTCSNTPKLLRKITRSVTNPFPLFTVTRDQRTASKQLY